MKNIFIKNKLHIPYKNYGKYYTIIDIDDYKKIKDYTWNFVGGYARTTVNRKSIGMHNLVMGAMNIDHEDLNKLNNRKNNLREATNSQNGANKPKNTNILNGYHKNTTIYKGVMKRKGYEKYRARIRKDGKLISY
jgi:hypothetical protein